MKYNPSTAPPIEQWLALDEAERMTLIERYHERAKIRLPRPRLQAAIHAAVETQLAMRLPPVVDALARLRAEGLDRHEAVHAIGSVLAEHMRQLLARELTVDDPNPAYYAALAELTVTSWHRDFGSSTMPPNER